MKPLTDEHASELPPPAAAPGEAWDVLPDQAPYDRLGETAAAATSARMRWTLRLRAGVTMLRAAAVRASQRIAARATTTAASAADLARRSTDRVAPTIRDAAERRRERRDDVE